MAEAHARLRKILEDPPQALLDLREKHGVRSFFNWNNDYTGAARDAMAYRRDLWLYRSSLIKWISETNRDGRCVLPDRAALERFAKRCLDSYPSC